VRFPAKTSTRSRVVVLAAAVALVLVALSLLRFLFRPPPAHPEAMQPTAPATKAGEALSGDQLPVGAATTRAAPDKEAQDVAVNRAIAFLCTNQLPSGEFRTWVSRDKEMKADALYYASPFISAFVLYSTSFVEDSRIAPMTRKTLPFFLQEKEGPGIWKIWTSKNNLERLVRPVPPDLDTTSVVSYALRKNGIPIESNKKYFLANTNNQGVFYTFVAPGGPRGRDICGVVNANVLFYLGENEQTRAACRFLNGIIADKAESRCSVWYNNDPFPFYYALSRAYFNGASSLGLSKEPVIKRIISMQKADGSFGDELSTAFAACTLLNLAYRGASLDKAIQRIRDTQAGDGSWPRCPFFGGRGFYFGSEEFTTAICVEALARYGLPKESSPSPSESSGPAPERKYADESASHKSWLKKVLAGTTVGRWTAKQSAAS